MFASRKNAVVGCTNDDKLAIFGGSGYDDETYCSDYCIIDPFSEDAPVVRPTYKGNVKGQSGFAAAYNQA